MNINRSNSSKAKRVFGARNRKQKGQGMTEYIIIVALIAVSAIGVFRLFGDTMRNQVAGLAQELSGQSGADQITASQGTATAAAAAAAVQKDLSNYSNSNQTGGAGN